MHKLIAQSGVASRRAAELLILEGRVAVNGHTIKELGAKADPLNDHIVVDGKPLKPPGAPIVLLLNKPKSYVSTRSDPEGRATVMDLLPKKYQHLYPVGRLDFETAGVLLLTNDGELTNLLTHPSHGVTKTYWARVQGHPTKAALQKVAHGLTLEDGPTAPCQVRLRAETDKNALVEVVLREGRNRQVRRMLEAVGYPVRALRRVKFGNLDLEGLPTGEFRELLPTEVRQLRKTAEPTSSKDRAEKSKSAKPSVRMPKSGRVKSNRAEPNKPSAVRPPEKSDNPKLGFNRPRPNSRADRPKSVKPREEKPRAERPERAEQPKNASARHPLSRRIKRVWDD